VEKYGRTRQTTNDNATLCMRIARVITKATNSHSEYVILIAFLRQQRFGKRASVLRYTLHVLVNHLHCTEVQIMSSVSLVMSLPR
jgi:hypothetical protein